MKINTQRYSEELEVVISERGVGDTRDWGFLEVVEDFLTLKYVHV